MTEPGGGLSRGALLVPFAKVWFIVTAFVTNFTLPNLLDAAALGDFGIVNRLISLVNMVVVTGSLQSVSRFVSSRPEDAGRLRGAGLRAQFVVAGALTLGLLVFAGPVAEAFQDGRLASPLRVAALIPLLYGFYAVHVGTLNGLHRFGAQAAFDVAFATLKTIALVATAALGFGVMGIFGAFAAVAAVILVVALLHGRPFAREAATAAPLPSARVVAAFAVPLVGAILVSQALLSADLFVLKMVLPPGADSRVLAGAYFAMLNFAVVPVMLVVAVNAIAFPLVSRASSAADAPRTAATVGQSLRLALILAGGFAVVVIASPADCLRLVYPSKPEFAAHAGALAVLGAASLLLCLLSVTTTLLSGIGRPALALMVSGVTLALQVVTVALAAPRHGLVGAAAGSALAFLAGSALGLVLLRRRLGAGLSPLTAVRVGAAMVPAVLVGRVLDYHGLAFAGEAILGGLVFVAGLVILREVGPADALALRSMARRRG